MIGVPDAMGYKAHIYRTGRRVDRFSATGSDMLDADGKINESAVDAAIGDFIASINAERIDVKIGEREWGAFSPQK